MSRFATSHIQCLDTQANSTSQTRPGTSSSQLHLTDQALHQANSTSQTRHFIRPTPPHRPGTSSGQLHLADQALHQANSTSQTRHFIRPTPPHRPGTSSGQLHLADQALHLNNGHDHDNTQSSDARLSTCKCKSLQLINKKWRMTQLKSNAAVYS
jgi:hypothetical protein